MIKIYNHLFNQLIENDSILNKFKYIIFETEDLFLVRALITVRFLDPKIFTNIYAEDFKFEIINKIELEKYTLFISKYQILWDKLYLDYIYS